MIPTKLLFLSPVVLLTACISLPDVEAPQTPPDGTPDSGTPPSVTVTLAAPGGTTYTHGTVSVQLQLQGDTPEQVELLVDDQPLTTLQAPYTFSWDTTSVAEGSHRLAARARIGDNIFASEARDVVVDRTPPQVVTRTPTPGAQDVWVRQPIQATFSEPLEPSTLTGASVQLFVAGTAVSSTSTLSADGKTLTIAPAASLAVPNPLQSILTADVTDLAGNPLVVPGSTWTWSLPTSFLMGSLSAVAGNTSAEAPSLQLDSQGMPFLAWREQVSLNQGNVYAYHWTGSDWEALGSALNSAPTLTRLAADSNVNQIIRVDSSNSPVVAWAEADGTEPGIHVKRWSNNAWGSIGGPLNAFPTSSKTPQSLALQFDDKDRPVIAWEQFDTSDNLPTISIWRWTGQNWVDFGPPQFADQLEGRSYPSLALDHSNNPVVAWASYSSDPALNGVIVRRWTGSNWQTLGSALDAVPQDPTSPTTPNLILDSSDAPVVAWSEYDGAAFNIYTSRWTGSTWQPLGSALSAVPGKTDAMSPKLAKDAAGTLFIMWCENGFGGQISRWNGSSWESIGGPAPCNDLGFTVDNSGTPFVTYPMLVDSSTGVTSINTYRYNH